jgi:hypothetical protein
LHINSGSNAPLLKAFRHRVSAPSGDSDSLLILWKAGSSRRRSSRPGAISIYNPGPRLQPSSLIRKASLLSRSPFWKIKISPAANSASSPRTPPVSPDLESSGRRASVIPWKCHPNCPPPSALPSPANSPLPRRRSP